MHTCWVAVKGYRGKYAISSTGEVLSFARGNPRILKQGCHPDGYPLVYINQKPACVHKLVAEVFLGDRPDGLQVNHKDGNKQNNDFSNLEYVTQAENLSHAQRTGLMDGRAIGERVSTAKLSDEEVRQIRALYRRGEPGCGLESIASRYGITAANVSNIVRRKTWKHVA